MKPEAGAHNVLSTTRARAKMHEFRVASEDFNALPRDPAMLFALAIGILGDVAAAVANQIGNELGLPLDDLPRPSGWGAADGNPQASLSFASTFFDAYLNADLGVDLTSELSLLCASAYYIAGNVGSAAVVVRLMPEIDPALAGGLCRILHQILRNDFAATEATSTDVDLTSTLMDAIARFFRFEGDASAVADACNKIRDQSYKLGSPRELLYGDLVCAVCTLKLRNASRTKLPIASKLDVTSWLPAFSKNHFPKELWPAQQRIADFGVLAGRSAVIQMPTSAGKTRATELIIRSAFLSKRTQLAVIVAPYRSLCHDIRGDLAVAISGENIRLDEASDAYQFDMEIDSLYVEDSILVVTPEKLLYMLRRAPDLAERIGLVIYDEGHQFDGLARGPTYELLLTSLRMALPADAQIVLISAVIGNAADVAAWLIGDAGAVIGGDGLLPTTKSIAFASWQDQRGRLEYVNPQDPTEREFFVPRVIGDIELPRRGRERTERRFPEKTGGDVGLFLGLHVAPTGSVAIFCGRKDSVTKICARAVEIMDRGVTLNWPVVSSDATEVERIRLLCELELGAPASATRAAGLGIFAHHADVPHGIRLAVEHAMKEGLARFVVCTSTLAQGVNFPLKYLIVTSTRQGGEQMLVRDFHNLMGRAGRAGMHTEGSVIFSTPSIFDQRRQFSGRWTWRRAIELLDARNSEPSRSSILALFDPYEQIQPPVTVEIPTDWLDLTFADAARLDSITAAAVGVQPKVNPREFRQFIEARARTVQSIAAFLIANMTFDEGEEADTRIEILAANTLAYHLAEDETRTRLVDLLLSIGRAVADNTDVAQRALIRRSPLPPAAVAEIRAWLTENLDALRRAASEGRLLDDLAPLALRFATSRAIRTIDPQNVISRALDAWVSGRSFATIFETLTEAEARAGRGRVTIEDAVALCEGGFGYDVAMIVASVTDLAEDLDNELQSSAAFLQRQIKCGLSGKSAIAFYEAGFADRAVATLLGNAWADVSDRAGVRKACKQEDVVRGVLAHLPKYFTVVAAEFGGWAL